MPFYLFLLYMFILKKRKKSLWLWSPDTKELPLQARIDLWGGEDRLLQHVVLRFLSESLPNLSKSQSDDQNLVAHAHLSARRLEL